MPTIDSDTHVIETERTWDFIEPADQKHRPVIVTPRGQESTEYWMVDGKLWGTARFGGRDFKKLSELSGRDMNAPVEAREMDDIDRRLAHMDELEVDTQVLYPTIFLGRAAERPAVDVAICRGYNRWLADIWSRSNDRLKWCLVPPLLSMPDALDELRWGKEHGACGVFMRSIEGQRVLSDPYLFPLYEEASRLNLPVTIHIANSNQDTAALLSQYTNNSTFWNLRLALVGAFHWMIQNDMPERFPQLRFGFIEAAAGWIPYALKDLKRRLPALGKKMPDEPLRDYRMFVTCQTDDDIQYVMKYAGEDQLLIGTDYGHNDQSSELEALRHLRTSGDVTADQYRKITWDNPKNLYGL